MPVPPEALTIPGLAKQTYLTPYQRQSVMESIDHLNFMIKDPETREVAVPNTDRLYSNLRKDEKMLEDGTPPEYDSETKNRLNRLRHQLETDIRHGMPTADMMERPTPNNVDLHIWWERENIQRVQAWKAVCRTLDPLNTEPNFTNIARLRPDTPPQGNPRKYWQGFDAISWEEQIDTQLLDTMDDHVYQTFLELRLLDWTKASICKELALTPAMYEAAMERLRVATGHKKDEQAAPQTPPAPSVSANGSVHPEPDAGPARARSEPGWPLQEIRATGISQAAFCKLAGVSLSALCRGAKDGAFTQQFREKIEKGLDKARARYAAEQRRKGLPSLLLEDGDAHAVPV